MIRLCMFSVDKRSSLFHLKFIDKKKKKNDSFLIENSALCYKHYYAPRVMIYNHTVGFNLQYNLHS
jgi:hypothetical protein